MADLFRSLSPVERVTSGQASMLRVGKCEHGEMISCVNMLTTYNYNQYVVVAARSRELRTTMRETSEGSRANINY